MTVDGEQSPVGSGTKASSLLRVLLTRPVEFYDRVRARAEVKARERHPTVLKYVETPWESFARSASALLSGHSFARDDREFVSLWEKLNPQVDAVGSPFPVLFHGDPVLARVAYQLIRALRPDVVVETGVAMGVVSTAILTALERNQHGRLVSIDLPPLGVSDDSIGRVIPAELRSRWTLMRGTSTRVLKRVLGDLPRVGLFLHDSLFTERNTREEFSLVLPRLARPAAIVANCVHHTGTFQRIIDTSKPSLHAVIGAEVKRGEQIGVCIYSQQ